jgi:hypothetical protein
MRRVWFSFLLAASLLVYKPSLAQEVHTLTAPAVTTTSTYTISYVGLDVANSTIRVDIVSNTGLHVFKTYDASTTPTGATLLHNLNTANFTTTSLVKQVFNRLQADGVISAGSVSGIPQ